MDSEPSWEGTATTRADSITGNMPTSGPLQNTTRTMPGLVLWAPSTGACTARLGSKSTASVFVASRILPELQRGLINSWFGACSDLFSLEIVRSHSFRRRFQDMVPKKRKRRPAGASLRFYGTVGYGGYLVRASSISSQAHCLSTSAWKAAITSGCFFRCLKRPWLNTQSVTGFLAVGR